MKLSLVVSLEETGFDAVAMRGSWREALRTAADLGYDGVELAVRDPSEVDAEAVLRTVRDAGSRCRQSGQGRRF